MHTIQGLFAAANARPGAAAAAAAAAAAREEREAVERQRTGRARATSLHTIFLFFVFMGFTKSPLCAGMNATFLSAGSDKPSYFAMCLAVKDQAIDLREWIEYHQRKGCSKFYIFDDNSSVPLINGILDFVTNGTVEYTYVARPKMPNPQIYIYERCIREFSERHTWIAFVDADEFIVIRNGKQIPDILRNFEMYGGVTLNWKMFGSSGHVFRPNGGTLANYHHCNPNCHVKSIVNPKRTLRSTGDPHSFVYDSGFYAVDTNYSRVDGPWNPPGSADCPKPVPPQLYEVMYINHYVLKSLEDFRHKSQRGSGDLGRKDMAFFHAVDSGLKSECELLSMDG